LSPEDESAVLWPKVSDLNQLLVQIMNTDIIFIALTYALNTDKI